MILAWILAVINRKLLDLKIKMKVRLRYSKMKYLILMILEALIWEMIHLSYCNLKIRNLNSIITK
jgi:hypothetical protein